MALIAEDGTGKLDAESYISLAAFKAYCDKLGLTYPAVDATCEIMLRKATAYMVAVFRGSWQGYRTIFNQALDFPRVDVWRDEFDEIANDVVPPEVLAACCELALISQTTDLQPTLITRTKKRVKVGPIDIEYDGSGPALSAFSNAVRRLAPLLGSGSGLGFSAKVERS